MVALGFGRGLRFSMGCARGETQPIPITLDQSALLQREEVVAAYDYVVQHVDA